MKRNSMRRIISLLVLLLILPMTVSAGELPYSSYTYNAWDESVPSPAGYTPVSVYTGEDLGVGMLKDPKDMYVGNDDNLYLSDTGNNRVLVFNETFELIREIKTVVQDGAERPLETPEGLFLDNQGLLYICENKAGRIIAVDNSNTVQTVFGRPDSELIDESLDFLPSKVLVNRLGTVYVIVSGYYMGAMAYNKDGSFKGFYGSNKVEVTLSVLVDQFWKGLFTQAQKDKMTRYVPIQYSNFDIDAEGFIYTCTKTTKTSLDEIKKLNSQGSNVLPVYQRNTGVTGDYGDLEKGWINAKLSDTQFVDICVNDEGFIFGLDFTRGRIFQYDQESRLLQVFGGIGSQMGTFKLPEAIDSMGEKLMVLDSGKCQVTVFEPTAFGDLVEQAVLLYNDGRYSEAKSMWEQVLVDNVNYEIAFDGVGKALFEEGEFVEAMEYFRYAYSRDNYSDAFKEYRSNLIRQLFPWFVGGLVIVIAGVWLLLKLRKRRPQTASVALAPWQQTVKSIGRVLFHGTDEYAELKYQRRFSGKASLVILAALFISAIVQRQLTGFIFNHNKLEDLNVLTLFASTVLLFALVVIGNWSVTTLLDGKGKISEIWVSLSYALIPFIITTLVGTALSNTLIAEEGVFLTIVEAIGLLWSLYLVISAMMSVHQYSFGKAIICLLLTAAAVAFMLFLMVLAFGLVQQLSAFVSTIYNELMYRR